MAADPAVVKAITQNLETTYTSLRAASNNIAGLLNAGRATCDEVQAYNLWALSTYNLQRGMLETLRAAGEIVPTLPNYPTLFAWRGQAGTAAINFDCRGQESSLSGPRSMHFLGAAKPRMLRQAMRRALSGPANDATFLSADQVTIVGGNEDDAALAPAFATLANRQLGIAPIVVLLIAGISVAVYFGIQALADYLTESDIQRESTERTAIQAVAFEQFTRARLACHNDCIARGGTQEACASTCARLVEKPDIKLDALRAAKDWTLTQWIGVSVLIGGGAIIAMKLWDKKKRDGRILPSFTDVVGGDRY